MNIDYTEFAVNKFAEMKGWEDGSYEIFYDKITHDHVIFNIDLDFFSQLPIKSNGKYLNYLWAVMQLEISEVYGKGYDQNKRLFSYENSEDDAITMLIHNATLDQRLEAYWKSENE